MCSDIEFPNVYICGWCSSSIPDKKIIVDLPLKKRLYIFCEECFSDIMKHKFGNDWETAVEDWVLTVPHVDVWWYVFESSELGLPLSCINYFYN